MEKMKPFPKPISFKKLLGPSFIILALGLGSGEVILWPYLVSNVGLGIAWGAILGITLQYFINMEIERYALVRGESVFVGLARTGRWTPIWFIFSTFLGFGLPGIIAASAKVIATLFGIQSFQYIAIIMLIGIGLILSLGKTVYSLMERLTKTMLLIGVPALFLLAIFLSSRADVGALFAGFIGRGDGFFLFPAGISFATFFAAFAYSGAGGNLNLTQSIYVKEKGYGMGAYAQKIAGLFRNVKEKQRIELSGHTFALTEKNLTHFRTWWKLVSCEHALVFWGIGVVSMALLMLLAFSTTFGGIDTSQGIQFVLNEGKAIEQILHPAVGIFFLIVVAMMLFQTQIGIMDSTSRIMAENTALMKTRGKEHAPVSLSLYYYTFLWAEIAFGGILFLLNIYEPKTLIVLGAVLNAFAMFVHIGLVNWMNRKTLPKQLQPHWFRKLMIVCAFLLFGCFSVMTLFQEIKKLFY